MLRTRPTRRHCVERENAFQYPAAPIRRFAAQVAAVELKSIFTFSLAGRRFAVWNSMQPVPQISAAAERVGSQGPRYGSDAKHPRVQGYALLRGCGA